MSISQASRIPLSSGNFGNAANIAGAGVRLGFRPGAAPGRTLIEAFYTQTPSDVYTEKPQVPLWGVQVGRSLRPPGTTRPNALWAVGLGRIDFVTTPVKPCGAGCLREGGTNFRTAGITTMAGDAGIVFPFARVAALRADLRVHQPVASSPDRGDNGTTRFEFSAGLTVRW